MSLPTDSGSRASRGCQSGKLLQALRIQMKAEAKREGKQPEQWAARISRQLDDAYEGVVVRFRYSGDAKSTRRLLDRNKAAGETFN